MKYFYIAVGVISLIIGAIGIVVVMLPTTPFFLLSAFCFSKSSHRLDRWFKNTKIYNKFVSSYVEKKAMNKKTKIKLLLILTVFFVLGFYFSPNVAKIIIVFVLACHYYYFLFIVKTKHEGN